MNKKLPILIFDLPLTWSTATTSISSNFNILRALSSFTIWWATTLITTTAVITWLDPCIICDWHFAIAQKYNRATFTAFFTRPIYCHLAGVIGLQRITGRRWCLTFQVIITFAIIIICGVQWVYGIVWINGVHCYVIVTRVFNLLHTTVWPILGASGCATTVNIKTYEKCVFLAGI